MSKLVKKQQWESWRNEQTSKKVVKVKETKNLLKTKYKWENCAKKRREKCSKSEKSVQSKIMEKRVPEKQYREECKNVGEMRKV